MDDQEQIDTIKARLDEVEEIIPDNKGIIDQVLMMFFVD